MFGILLCFIRLRAKLARSSNDGIAEKLSQFGGRQFQRTNRLNNHAVFFFLTLFLQIPDFGLPLCGFLTGLRQLFVDFSSLVMDSSFLKISSNAQRRKSVPASNLY